MRRGDHETDSCEVVLGVSFLRSFRDCQHPDLFGADLRAVRGVHDECPLRQETLVIMVAEDLGVSRGAGENNG